MRDPIRTKATQFYCDDESRRLLDWIDGLTIDELVLLKALWEQMKDKQ